MKEKLPIIDAPVSLDDILVALRRTYERPVRDELLAALGQFTGLSETSVFSSGLAVYYLILKALKERYGKDEVVLPAYTAGSLIVAVRKARLRPVLCDISLGDFNGEANEMIAAISPRTLAVTCVHMFGIGMEGIARVREALPPGTVLIEDCCQSMGSRIHGRLTGGFGDIAFWSFNRGKNLPLSGGGCAATDSRILGRALRDGAAAAGVDRPGPKGWGAAVKNALLLFALQPGIYGMTYPVSARFKSNAPPPDVKVGPLSDLQAALGCILLERAGELFARRYANGTALIEGLKEMPGVLTPVIPSGSTAAFNRLPVVFEEPSLRARAERLLWRRGIETSRMYIRPLHHMFDLGYPQDAFPHATYVAQRLLTLPTHPGVTEAHIDSMTDTIRSVV